MNRREQDASERIPQALQVRLALASDFIIEGGEGADDWRGGTLDGLQGLQNLGNALQRQVIDSGRDEKEVGRIESAALESANSGRRVDDNVVEPVAADRAF